MSKFEIPIDKALFNTRDYCRERIIKYLNYYQKGDYQRIGASFGVSIAQFVNKIAYNIHGAYYFCDEIDIEVLFVMYHRNKKIDFRQYPPDFLRLLIGYMAERLQIRINAFYKELKKGEFEVNRHNISLKKDKELFLKKLDNLCEEKPKLIRRKIKL